MSSYFLKHIIIQNFIMKAAWHKIIACDCTCIFIKHNLRFQLFVILGIHFIYLFCIAFRNFVRINFNKLIKLLLIYWFTSYIFSKINYNANKNNFKYLILRLIVNFFHPNAYTWSLFIYIYIDIKAFFGYKHLQKISL